MSPLYVDGASDGIAFYERAFGAAELFRMARPNGKILHAEISMTDRMTKMATASSYGVKLLRNAVLSIVGGMPFAQHALAQKLSELETRLGTNHAER